VGLSDSVLPLDPTYSFLQFFKILSRYFFGDVYAVIVVIVIALIHFKFLFFYGYNLLSFWTVLMLFQKVFKVSL